MYECVCVCVCMCVIGNMKINLAELLTTSTNRLTGPSNRVRAMTSERIFWENLEIWISGTLQIFGLSSRA